MSLKQRLAALGGTGVVLLAASFLGPIEQPVLRPYTDIGGVQTWCFGQTQGTPKARYTAQECEQDLLRTVQQYRTALRPYVPSAAPESVQAAMVSIAYNVGVSGWRWELDDQGLPVPSRLQRNLARHDWEATCAAIVAPWKGKHGVSQGFKATVKGKPSRGLQNRRAAEYQLCMEDL